MIHLNEKPQSATADDTSFEIEPLNAPLFVIMQPTQGGEGFSEAGYVWTVGSSRTNSQENWYLYETAGGSGLQAYQWPGYDQTGRQVGTTLQLVPATWPAGQNPSTFKAYLESTKRVTVTYITAACRAGGSR
jgi:hypothetical protein